MQARQAPGRIAREDTDDLDAEEAPVLPGRHEQERGVSPVRLGYLMVMAGRHRGTARERLARSRDQRGERRRSRVNSASITVMAESVVMSLPRGWPRASVRRRCRR